MIQKIQKSFCIQRGRELQGTAVTYSTIKPCVPPPHCIMPMFLWRKFQGTNQHNRMCLFIYKIVIILKYFNM